MIFPPFVAPVREELDHASLNLEYGLGCEFCLNSKGPSRAVVKALAFEVGSPPDNDVFIPFNQTHYFSEWPHSGIGNDVENPEFHRPVFRSSSRAFNTSPWGSLGLAMVQKSLSLPEPV
jgi:hypothetical protein